MYLVGATCLLVVCMGQPYADLSPRIGTGAKKVAAFYYGWYSNATNYSQARPYTIVDDTKTRHYPNIFNTPLQGQFDSADPAVIEQHLRWAEWAGIDALVCSFWGKGGFEWANFQNMLRVANYIHSNLTFSVYFEIFMGGLDEKPSTEQSAIMVSEFRAIYELFNNTEYRDLIWFEQGRPVLFSYVTQAVTPAAWNTTVHTLADEKIEFFICADRPGTGATMNEVFQATHQYDVYYPTYHGSYYATFLGLKQTAKQYGQLFAAGVTPGYDDHIVRPGNPPVARDGGQTYKESWERAISLNPDWITITSWNEWHEGTEIEPSVENGDLALNQTRTYIAEFKSGIYEELQPQQFYGQLVQKPILALLAGWAAWSVLFLVDRKQWFRGRLEQFIRFHVPPQFLGVLLVLVAWGGLGFTAVYELGLGNHFAITGQDWVYLLPVLAVVHVLGIGLVSAFRTKGEIDRPEETHVGNNLSRMGTNAIR